MGDASLPLVGSWTIRVDAVRPFTIHGDRYYELQITRLDENKSTFIVRVPEHAAEQAPQVGERLTVGFLMGQITSMKRQDQPAD